ncbi:MAG: GNAT family N-acetyltransferase [Planctomycetes bacterium]|nr:GNAT family N-acetyltransferase [Planctomycetota bacterium]
MRAGKFKPAPGAPLILVPVEIRRLGPADSLEELTLLLHRAYSVLGGMGFNYTAVDQPVERTRERALDGECYVAIEDGRLAGTVTLGLVDAMADPPEYGRPGMAYVTQFAVEPALQGKGLGSRLLRHVEERARELGAREIALDTAEGATHLIRYYEARGYSGIGRVRFGGKTYRSIVLGKPLTRRTGA